MIDPRVQLRPATMADVPLLERWDDEPHVIAATHEDPDDADEVLPDYWADELGKQSPIYQYFIGEVDGRPVGAMLLIDPHLEPSHYWGEIEPNLRALDIWIGESRDLGQGYGEHMMRRAFVLCFSDPHVTSIVIDPLASNTRAQKFYRRLGFVAEGRRTFGEDDCLVHRLTRETWRARFANDAAAP